MAAVAFCVMPAADATLTNATWLGGTGNWDDGTQWSSSPLFPNNGGTLTWNATVPSGTAAVDTNITIQQFNLTGGTVNGSSNLTANNLTSWTGGTMGGSGETLANGGIAINGSAFLDTRTLITAGSSTLTNGALYGANGAVLSNRVGATFNLLDDSSVIYDGGALPQFLNAGTLLKSGAGNNASGEGLGVSLISWALTNSGTVQCNAGTLSIGGGGLSSGTVTTAPGATVRFASNYTVDGPVVGPGNIEFDGGTVYVVSNYDVTGSNVFDGGNVTFSNAVTLGQTLSVSAGQVLFVGGGVAVTTLNLSGGTLGSPSNMTLSGLSTWAGGTMSGSGETLANGGIAINGSALLDTRTLLTAGSSTLTNGALYGANGAVLSNRVGATFNLLDDSSVIYDGGALPQFLNAGTLLKSGAGNNASGEGLGVSLISWALTNSGTVTVEAGTLSFSGGYVQMAGTTELSGGTLVSSTPLTIQGGSLIGTGTVVATVLNNGILSPGFGTAGSLSINGPLTQQSASILLMEIGGYARGTQYDFVNVGGTAAFGGSLAVMFVDGFNFISSVTNGASFTLLTASSPIVGAFNNVSNGGVLTTSDGFARVTVNYGGLNLVLTGLQIVDSVGDGIPNWWRAKYFGGTGATANGSSCATCDADGTGQNNLFKYVAGLDPTNPASIFVLNVASVISQPSQKNLIYNPIATGRTYTVQYRTNLVSGVYTNLTGFSGPATNITQATVTDLGATNQTKFYRIDISLP